MEVFPSKLSLSPLGRDSTSHSSLPTVLTPFSPAYLILDEACLPTLAQNPNRKYLHLFQAAQPSPAGGPREGAKQGPNWEACKMRGTLVRPAEGLSHHLKGEERVGNARGSRPHRVV